MIFFRIRRLLKLYEINSYNGMFSKFSKYQRKIRRALSKDKLLLIKFLFYGFLFIHLFSCI